MIASGLMLLAVLGARPALPAASVPHRAIETVRRAFERLGRRAPTADPLLSAAASLLAQRALEDGAARAAAPDALISAVSRSGGFDPSPRALIVRADEAEGLLDALERRADLAGSPASRLGAGWAKGSGRYALAVMLTERKAELDPFPHHLPAPGLEQTLRGALLPPLAHPELFVTRPDGTVCRPAVSSAGAGAGFSAPLRFAQAGRYTVELVGRGPKGPAVAALFFVRVGPQPAPRAETGEALATDSESHAPIQRSSAPDLDRARLLTRIGALRASFGAPPLIEDPALDRIAQDYSARMARAHFLAHVDPSGNSLSDRLRSARYPFTAAGENLASAATVRSAEASLEQSPGHRANLLDRSFDRAGVGIAFERMDGRVQVLLTEIFVRPSGVASSEMAAPSATSHLTGGRTLESSRAPLFERSSP